MSAGLVVFASVLGAYLIAVAVMLAALSLADFLRRYLSR